MNRPAAVLGQPRCWASRRRARSGFTALGWPTASSIGRSVIESLQAEQSASR
ncbi:MAG: hypothetical protein ACLP5E_04800 [Streptosporangiaceae bacterium]